MSEMAERQKIIPGAIVRPIRRAGSKRGLSLALQGGGSFGAFTWGVLDRLLGDERIVLDAISGTSAGAINAVVLADGLAEGGPAKAREKLDRFWRRLSDAGAFSGLGQLTAVSAAPSILQVSAPLVSPYQFNPFGLDPLRDILREEVDFARLRAASPVRLVIAATRVKDGRARLFRNAEITLDSVLASACMPLLHHAVEIDEEWYWDGGYSVNPPLRALVAESKADDVLLVQLTPAEYEGVPRLAPEIARRVGQIVFNHALHKELDALADLVDLCRDEGIARSRFCRKLQRLRLHHIAAEHVVEGLNGANALNLDRAFVGELRQKG